MLPEMSSIPSLDLAASVDQTEARCAAGFGPDDCLVRRGGNRARRLSEVRPWDRTDQGPALWSGDSLGLTMADGPIPGSRGCDPCAIRGRRRSGRVYTLRPGLLRVAKMMAARSTHDMVDHDSEPPGRARDSPRVSNRPRAARGKSRSSVRPPWRCSRLGWCRPQGCSPDHSDSSAPLDSSIPGSCGSSRRSASSGSLGWVGLPRIISAYGAGTMKRVAARGRPSGAARRCRGRNTDGGMIWFSLTDLDHDRREIVVPPLR
jgi:hypothetical protein